MKIVIREQPNLYRTSPLDVFLEIPPYAADGIERAREKIKDRDYPRHRLAEMLQGYNDLIGNDQAAAGNIARIKEEDTVCVVTGQQLGFMGGPAYTVLKGVACLLAAREADAVPTFWLATDDHDVPEIDHTYLLDPLGNLQKYHLSLPRDGEAVEDLTLDPKHQPVLDKFSRAAGLALDDLENETSPHSYAQAMAKLLAKIFKGTGLVFLEPRLLRELAVPFFKREIKERSAITSILSQTTKRYQEAGGQPLITITEHPNLFLKDEGRHRLRIKWSQGAFLAGKTSYNEDDLLSLVDANPQLFSPNVAARPIMQSLLLPTLAYIAGPNEMTYYHQLLDYYHFHDVPMPWICPRISAVFVPPYAQTLLEGCRIEPWMDIPNAWPDIFPELLEGINETLEEWKKCALAHFQKDLDPESLSRYVSNYVLNMQRKILKRRLKGKRMPYHALHYLRNLLHPRSKPQERILNWFAFQSQTKDNIVGELLQKADWKARGCHYCFLE